MLVVFDEAQTGLGRTGDLWGGDRDGVAPDLLTISKTLGGGIPLAATATTAAIEEKAYREGFFFFTSHLNEPLPAAVGLAVLDVIAEEKLVDAARDKGAYLKRGLLVLKDRYEIVGDVRGRGLLMGVDFVTDRQSKRPAEAEAEAITRECHASRAPWPEPPCGYASHSRRVARSLSRGSRVNGRTGPMWMRRNSGCAGFTR